MAVTINASTSAGLVQTADTSGVLALQTAGTTAVTVDASQNVGVGVTPSAWFSGVKAIQFGTAGVLFSNSDRANLASNLYIDSGTNSRYINNGFALRYAQEVGEHVWSSAPSGTAGNVATLTRVLAVEKDKSLALQGAVQQTGTGITFPATQSASSNANTLDDYEEGTWTPTIFGTALGTVTYTSQDGKYTKIGRVVYLTCSVAWSNITSVGSGDNRIQGLPFSSGTSQTNGGATFYSSDGIATNPVLAGLFYNTEIYLRKSANILASTNISEAYNNSGSFAFNGYYFV